MQSRAQIPVPPRARRAPGARAVRAAALALCAAAAGCEPYVEGNGVAGQETRPVAAFVGVAATDGIKVFATCGASERSLRLEGDENLLEYVETTVAERAPFGPVLEIDMGDTAYRPKQDLQVYVATPSCAYVATDAASPVSVTGAAAEVFTVEAADGSIVSLEGGGGARLVLSLAGGQHGGARLDARAYPVEEAEVAVSGGAFASVRASASVEGTADAGARVENAGSGTCDVTATGGAQVVCAAP